MQKLNDLSRSLTPFKPVGTLIAVIEMSLSSWHVAGIVPGVERQPLKKLAVDRLTMVCGEAYATDPTRKAILLVAGDKSGVSQKTILPDFKSEPLTRDSLSTSKSSRK